jgi:hypothetical protein
MYTVSYEAGTAPKSLLVVSGIGRALNPTERSGKPQHTNLSAHNYDNVTAQHRGTPAYRYTERGLDYYDFVGRGPVNEARTEAFDTPVRVWRKVTGWMTVSGGKQGLTVTFSPDARVVLAVVEQGEGEDPIIVTDMSLNDFMDEYC